LHLSALGHALPSRGHVDALGFSSKGMNAESNAPTQSNEANLMNRKNDRTIVSIASTGGIVAVAIVSVEGAEFHRRRRPC
jgi:hypothetical protein